ncbi:MAG: PSD1 and planctomycete cytochrome C domain-containing protein [Planctomycetota bacterium]|nr:PSD1 and planctomycete cytochrome C domain-containing protein [Planctomycetota bacterium]
MRFFALTLALALSANLNAADPVDFNRDIRPLLADRCFACHGPDAKEVKAGLRLDLKDVATKPSESGKTAVTPGKADASELVRRVFSTDPDEQMPPAESHKQLNAAEKELFKRWIVEGAEYMDHWAFLSPEKEPLPPVQTKNWERNEIDRFVLAKLEAKGLKPSDPAASATLIRRVSLDLRGFPPTVAELDRFVKDTSPDAYEKMVDRMLDSPHFGEKMARIWMDLARYGDTNGYHYDSTRQVWLWRDWVIQAFNKNMPFSQFTIEQLGGDLLPNATVDQKVATGFVRNTRYNEEGGADPDEWRVEYAKDRARTLGQVWMGMTVGCAECHSHKYDPISQKEFYQLYAFFNSLDEPGSQGHNQQYPPLIQVPSKNQNVRIAKLDTDIAAARQQIQTALAAIKYAESKEVATKPTPMPIDEVWIDDNAPKGAVLQGQGNPAWQWITKADGPVHLGARATKRSGAGLSQHFFTKADPLEVKAEDVLFEWVWLDPKNPPKTVQMQFNDGVWEHRAFWGERLGHGNPKEGPHNHRVGDLPKTGEWVRLEVSAKAVGLKPGAKINGWAFTQFDGTVYYDHAGVTRITADARYLESLAVWETKAANDAGVPEAVRNAVKVLAAKRNDQQSKSIGDYYIEHVHGASRKTFAPLHARVKSAEAEIAKIKSSTPFQLVSVEMETPRPAFMLDRGDFLKPGQQVERNTPAVFPKMAKDLPRNRLGLAKWLVSGEHPLTARVAVNRFWAQLFGGGIVETIGDFGHLGRFPSHPKVLDWLAVEFVESGWDTKHILKLMVMSATYRQSSVNDHRHDAVDPTNVLLWRAPRFRLPAEEIRDSALKIAGLLNEQVGGPPAFPYQPMDYYKGKKGGWSWNLSNDDDRYRRGLYTFWRRTTPYPTFVIFDAPDRSECVVSRARTNTPLQALATLNDPQFVEAARVFAQQVLAGDPMETGGRIRLAFRRAVSRDPSDEEVKVVQSLLEDELKFYRANPEEAKSLVNAGAYPQPKDTDQAEHAAWTAVTNALLNLDETINRE